MSTIEDYLKECKKKMEECDHLFIKEKEGEWDVSFHLSDTTYDPPQVCCLKCGLNNRRLLYNRRKQFDYEVYLALKNIPILCLSYVNNYINDKVFEETFELGWQDRCAANGASKVFNLISDEPLACRDPVRLYRLAKAIKPDGDNGKLFKLVKRLNRIEVDDNIEIVNVDEAKELLNQSVKKIGEK